MITHCQVMHLVFLVAGSVLGALGVGFVQWLDRLMD